MKKEFIYKPIMHEPHSVRWPNFERNFYLVLWVATLLLIVGALIVMRLGSNERARALKQHQEERAAIENGNAVKVSP